MYFFHVVITSQVKQKITFQLDKANIAKLRQLSKSESISSDMLIDQMLVQYLSHRTSSTIYDYIPIRKILLIRLLKKFTEQEVTSMAKSLATISTKKIIIRLRQEFNVMSSVDVVEALIRLSSHKYRHEVNYGIHQFVIQHNLGKKWSLYLYEIYSSVLRQFRFKKVNIVADNNKLTFTIIIKTIL